MRILVTVAANISSTSFVSFTTLESAEAYPFCLAGSSNNAMKCDYADLEQCRAAASGGSAASGAAAADRMFSKPI